MYQPSPAKAGTPGEKKAPREKASPAKAGTAEKKAASAQPSPAKAATPGGDKKKTPAPEKAAAELKPEAMQEQPGMEVEMEQKPIFIREGYKGSGKLEGKVAIVTGGDSGIGRSVAVHYAREGADVAVVYLSEHADAQDTEALVKAEGRKCLLFAGDVGEAKTCKDVVTKTVDALGRLDILVNNAGEQHVCESLADLSDAQIERTFKTNACGYVYMARAALPHLKEGASIINCSSVTAFVGEPALVDYSMTKAAEIGLTRSLAHQLAPKGIRVNAVAPGPIWTPLIPASFPKEKQGGSWKESTLRSRPGQPAEVGPSFVFLASADASLFTGQTLHPDGGKFIGS